MTLELFLSHMWTDYCQLNPDAKRIHDLLLESGESVENDHIALRTFNHPRLGIESLAKHFVKYGYVECNQYTFKEKKLFAKHFEHPDKNQPKIFISELQLEKTTANLQEIIHSIVDQISDYSINNDLFPASGRTWNIDTKTYQTLAKESEYAAWVASIGFRPNHFTVFINKLKKLNNIADLNNFIKENGYVLNASGGEIKGSPAEFLEQSSTMAKDINVQFSDAQMNVPGCYYEFAKRYKLPNGELYSGFIAASADKIFESTNKINLS